MLTAPGVPDRRLRWTAKRLAFSVLRAAAPVQLFDSARSASGRKLRVLHVGDPFRGRYFIEQLYGEYREGRQVGRTLVRPSPHRLPSRDIDCDLRLVEINRLYVEKFRQAGYFAIPEWVEFSRPVIGDEAARYSGASKSLRTDLKAIRDSGFQAGISHDASDFEMFYDRMYLPFVATRFGETTIAKSRRKLQKDFRAGFLMILRRDESPVAGAIVRVDGPTVSLTTLGVADGAESVLRMNVSGAIDYHLHAWAADNHKRRICVGHTRPFPRDGVFFNKRKWQMSIAPDMDGVMNMALQWLGPEPEMIDVLKDYPFIFQGRLGLGVLCAHVVDREMDANETNRLLKRYWTDGLKSIIAVCPGGYVEGVEREVHQLDHTRVYLCTDLGSAIEINRSEV